MPASHRYSAFRPYPLHEEVPGSHPPRVADTDPLPPLHPRQHRHHRWWLWTLGAVVVLLVGARLAAPYALCSYLNRQLEGLHDYQGHVDTVSMSLYRGAFQLHQIRVVSRPGITPGVDATCPNVDITLIWRRLFKRQIVASATVYHPHVVLNANEVRPPTGFSTRPAAIATGVDIPWQRTAEALPPILIHELQVAEVTLDYRDDSIGFNGPVARLTIGLTNLTNDAATSSLANRIISAKVSGDVLGHAQFDLAGEVDPFPTTPDFTTHFSLQHCDLTAYNLLLRHYAHLDLKHGVLNAYAEMQCQHGHLVGYLKPLLTDLATDSIHDARAKKLAVVKEVVVGATNAVIKNHPRHRLAGKIPLAGDLTAPKTRIMSTVISILGNGFIKALEPGFDHDGDAPDKQPLQEPAKANEAISKAKAKSK